MYIIRKYLEIMCIKLLITNLDSHLSIRLKQEFKKKKKN